MAFRILLFRTRVILIPSSQSVELMYVSVLKCNKWFPYFHFAKLTENQLVMMYWVKTVWESMLRMLGVIAITEVSNLRTIRLTVHT